MKLPPFGQMEGVFMLTAHGAGALHKTHENQVMESIYSEIQHGLNTLFEGDFHSKEE